MFRFFDEEKVKNETRNDLLSCTWLSPNVIGIVLEYFINDVYQSITYNYNQKDDQTQLDKIKVKEFKKSTETETDQIAVDTIKQGNIETFKWLVHNKHINMNKTISLNGSNISYLSLAILLIQNGIAFFILNQPELTADNIERSGSLAQNDPLAKLISHEASMGSSCGNALFHAIYCGQVEMVKCMLSKHATKIISFSGNEVDAISIIKYTIYGESNSYIRKKGLNSYLAEMARTILTLQDKIVAENKIDMGIHWEDEYIATLDEITTQAPYTLTEINAQVFNRLRNIFRSGGIFPSNDYSPRDKALTKHVHFTNEGTYRAVCEYPKYRIFSKPRYIKTDHLPRRNAVIEATNNCHVVSDFFRLAQNQRDIFSFDRNTPIDPKILPDRYSNREKLKKNAIGYYYREMGDILITLSIFCRQHNISLDTQEINPKPTEKKGKCLIM